MKNRKGSRRVMHKTKSIIFTLAACLLMAALCHGTEHKGLAGGRTSEPIDVESDSMELKSKDNLVIFSGSVTAKRGDMTVQSEALTIYLMEKSQDIERIEAEKKVGIRRGDMIATGDKAVFDLNADTVTLTGSPKIWRASGAVEGEKIVMHITEERVEVDKPHVFIEGDTFGGSTDKAPDGGK